MKNLIYKLTMYIIDNIFPIYLSQYKKIRMRL